MVETLKERSNPSHSISTKKAPLKTGLLQFSDSDLRTGIEQITEDDISVLSRLASAIFTETEFPYRLKEKTKKEILPKLMKKKWVNEREEVMAVIKIMGHFGLDTQLPLCESVENGAMAMDICRQLIREYDCTTASEKATAQLIANAHIRVLEYSATLKNCRYLERGTQLHLNFYSMIGKELDRATRQYEAALNTLMRMKSPAFKVNVVAKNAFVAENQQINFNKHENIKPK